MKVWRDGKTRRDPAEVGERTTRMVFESEREYPTQWKATVSIAEKFGDVGGDAALVVRQAEIDDGARPGVTLVDARRIEELEREHRRLPRANEILKAASAFFARELDPHPPR